MEDDVREKIEGPIHHTDSRSEEAPSANRVTTIDALEIKYTAPKHVSDIIAALALGRAEDVKFSPNNRRLAVVSYSKNRIVVFEVCIAASLSTKSIALTGACEFASEHLRLPHGVQFIDDEAIIVANRAGDITIFKLP